MAVARRPTTSWGTRTQPPSTPTWSVRVDPGGPVTSVITARGPDGAVSTTASATFTIT
jgi:hypothetical protein